jgi:hypothetical protein
MGREVVLGREAPCLVLSTEAFFQEPMLLDGCEDAQSSPKPFRTSSL